MSNYHPHSHPHALSHPHPQQVHNQLQNPHQNQLPPPQRHNHAAPTAAASASGAPSSSASASASASILVAHPPQPLISNSLAIRQEIQRFESVHPSIYAIYELIDLLPMADAQIAQSIRDHVVCIEGKSPSISAPSLMIIISYTRV